MGTRKAELTKAGELKLLGNINTRIPTITDGLIANFPFDNTAFDSVYGVEPETNINSNINLIEAVELDWRDVSNWTIYTQTGSLSWNEAEQAIEVTGGWWGTFNQWFKIDTSKNWYIEAKVKRVSGTGTFYLGDIAYNNIKTTTGVSQKPGTHEYWGASGNLPSSTEYTLYKNTTIGGASRTGENTNTSDRTTWYTGTEWIKYLFIANYSNAAGTMYIKDIKLYYTDYDASTTGMVTVDGLVLQEATANLLTGNNSFQSGTTSEWAISNATGGATEVIKNGYKHFQNSLRVFIADSGDQYQYKSTANLGDVSGQTFTYSVDVRSTNLTDPTTLRVIAYWKNSSSSWIWSNNLSAYSTKNGEWERLSVTAVAPTGTYYCSLIIRSTIDGRGSYEIANAQIENKAYSTAYTESSRTAQQFNIPLVDNVSSDFTIFYKFKPSVNWPTTSDASFNKYQWYLYDRNTGSKIWASDYAGSATGRLTSAPWIGFDEIEYYHWHESGITNVINGNYYFALTKSGTTWKRWIMDANGVNYTTLERTTQSIIDITPYKIELLDDYCQTISDFSFYNRALTDKEIDSLFNNNFDLKPSGDLVITGLETRPALPEDALYFPLDFDSKDKNKVISPIVETNIIFEDGSVWVGEGTTNLLSAVAYNVAPSYTLNDYYGWYLTGVANDNPRVTLYTENFAVAASTFYTFSAVYWSSNDIIDDVYLQFVGTGYPEGNVYMQPFRSAHTEGLSGSTTIIDLGDGWKKCIGTFQTTADTTAVNSIFVDSDVAGVNIFISNLQLEQKPYASPFTEVTTSNAQFKYSFPDILTPDNDWSVGVFAKTNSYNMDNTTIRVNVMEVGNYYNINESDCSWGRWNTTARYWSIIGYNNRVSEYSSGIQLSTGDAYDWNLFTFRYDSTANILYGDIYGLSGTRYSRSVTKLFTGLVSTVRLGGYNWDEDCFDGYLKDFFIVNRKLTDTELENIVKNKMEQSSDSIRLLSNIETGTELG